MLVSSTEAIDCDHCEGSFVTRYNAKCTMKRSHQRTKDVIRPDGRGSGRGRNRERAVLDVVLVVAISKGPSYETVLKRLRRVA